MTFYGIRQKIDQERIGQDIFSHIFDHKFHDLRCSYATYRLHSLLEAGIEPANALSLLMGWMGHKNESTTWKYLRYLKRKEVLKEKISMLDNIMHQSIEDSHEQVFETDRTMG